EGRVLEDRRVSENSRVSAGRNRRGVFYANAGFRGIERRAANPAGGVVVIPVDTGVAGGDEPAARRERRLSVDLEGPNPGQQADPLARTAPSDTSGEAHGVLRGHVDQVELIVELVERAVVAPGLARGRVPRDRPLTGGTRGGGVLIQDVVHLRAVRPDADDVVDALLRDAERRLHPAHVLRHP